MTHSTATSRRHPQNTGRATPRAGDRTPRAGDRTPRAGDRTPRAGSRTPREPETFEYPVDGATALAPERVTAPARRRDDPGREDARKLRVAPPVPVSGPRAPFVALVLVIVVAGVLGILVLNTKINENAFQLAGLRNQQATLDQQEQELSQHIADISSPNSLAAAARRLGLVPSGTPAFIKLPDGRVLGVPQPASGAPSASGSGQ